MRLYSANSKHGDKTAELWELEIGELTARINLYKKRTPVFHTLHRPIIRGIINELRTVDLERGAMLVLPAGWSGVTKKRAAVTLALMERERYWRTFSEYRVWLASMRAESNRINALAIGTIFADWLDESAGRLHEQGFRTMARRLRMNYERERIAQTKQRKPKKVKR